MRMRMRMRRREGCEGGRGRGEHSRSKRPTDRPAKHSSNVERKGYSDCCVAHTQYPHNHSHNHHHHRPCPYGDFLRGRFLRPKGRSKHDGTHDTGVVHLHRRCLPPCPRLCPPLRLHRRRPCHHRRRWKHWIMVMIMTTLHISVMSIWMSSLGRYHR